MEGIRSRAGAANIRCVYGDELAGYYELRSESEPDPPSPRLRRDRQGEVEIAYFGLLPEFIDRGLGGALLTSAIEEAWEMSPSACGCTRAIAIIRRRSRIIRRAAWSFIRWKKVRRKINMDKSTSFYVGFAVLLISSVAMAQEQGVIKPQLLLREIVQGMPKGEKQEVRVLTASFKPGDKTMLHTHHFPVTVYVLEGVFTLEMEGTRASHGESWSGDDNAAERENDRLQPQQHRPIAAGAL